MAVRLVTDSTVTLSPEDRALYDIRQVTLCLVYGGVAHPESTIDDAEFYEHLENMETLPTTSQPSPAEFLEVFSKILDEGDDVLGVFVSGGLSGTCEGARMIADQLAIERPETKDRVAVVDSQSCGSALAYPVLEAAKAAHKGEDLATCTDIAEYATACTRFVFTPHSLEYLRRGGRIGRASALLGSALKLCPVIGPDKLTGAVHTYAKVRTFSRALGAIKDKWLADIAASGGLKDLCVHYINQKAPAEAFREKVVVPLTKLVVPPPAPVSPVIGCHIGPAVGIAYITNEPMIPESVDGLSALTARASERFQMLKDKVAEKINYS